LGAKLAFFGFGLRGRRGGAFSVSASAARCWACAEALSSCGLVGGGLARPAVD